MDNLVSIINKLQEVFAVTGSEMLQLPQIVVVGAQSSGKSSVLESLVGKSFLPRGLGIVTRCPIILQLIQCMQTDLRRLNNNVPEKDDWASFLHKSNEIFTDYSQIRREIEIETERKAGYNKGICTDPIILRIYSERLSNLTMIDLPGFTKIPVGDQPLDIEKTIRNLIMHYIKNPNSIILAIVMGNTDMETNESLKIAREVDPDGSRTLAVVTKLDLMDAGTDASRVLNGEVIPVKLGIIGVVNRSQKAINEGRSINNSIVDEVAFLHKYYPKIASRHGSLYLAKTLQYILINHIQKCIPDLRHKVNLSIAHQKALLKSLDSTDVSNSLLNLLAKFSSSYCATVQGSYKNLEIKELVGGARISYIFYDVFGKAIDEIDPLNGLNKKCIMTALKNVSGPKPSLFIPELCFELLVKKQISKLESPSLRCVQLIHDELERVINNCGFEIALEMMKFPKLHKKISEVVIKLLKSRISITDDLIKNIINIHTSYVNTAHPEFVRDIISVGINCNFMKQGSIKCILPNKRNSLESFNDNNLVIESLIIAYFNVVKRSVQDSVPKVIMFSLVNYVMEHLLSVLVAGIYSEKNVENLLEESEAVCQKRKQTTNTLAALEKANSIIYEVNESSCMTKNSIII